MKRKLIYILLPFLLTACGPSAEDLAATYVAGTDIAQTTGEANIQQSIDATFTYEASLFTPTPTYTLTPTLTPTPTVTVTPTPVPMAEVIVESTTIREGPGNNYSIIQNVVMGDTFEIIGQNEDGSWIVVEVSAGVTGWIPSAEIELSVPSLSFQVIETPPPPLGTVVIRIENDSPNPIYYQIIPGAGIIRIGYHGSATVTVQAGTLQILIYNRDQRLVCQSTAFVSTNITFGGNSIAAICANLP